MCMSPSCPLVVLRVSKTLLIQMHVLKLCHPVSPMDVGFDLFLHPSDPSSQPSSDPYRKDQLAACLQLKRT